MRALRIFVDPDASLEFVEPTILPAAAPNARPWLIEIGDLTLNARSGAFRGTFSNENATLVVTLDNRQRQASTLLRRPLRARAEVDDRDISNYFVGIVRDVLYGTTLSLTLEA